LLPFSRTWNSSWRCSCGLTNCQQHARPAGIFRNGRADAAMPPRRRQALSITCTGQVAASAEQDATEVGTIISSIFPRRKPRRSDRGGGAPLTSLGFDLHLQAFVDRPQRRKTASPGSTDVREGDCKQARV
jgi:hypothetical protein